MSWSSSNPVKGTRLMGETLYDDLRHGGIERYGEGSFWNVSFIPDEWQKGMRATSYPYTWITDNVVGDREWLAMDWTDWETYEYYWITTRAGEELSEDEVNIFEEAIGEGITDWRDCVLKGGRANSRLACDAKLLVDQMWILDCPIDNTEDEFSIYSPMYTEQVPSGYWPSCSDIMELWEDSGYFLTAWAENPMSIAGALNTGGMGHSSSGYIAAWWGIGDWWVSMGGYTISLPEAKSGYESITGIAGKLIYQRASVEAFRTKQEKMKYWDPYTPGWKISCTTLGRAVTLSFRIGSGSIDTERTYEEAKSYGDEIISQTIESGEWVFEGDNPHYTGYTGPYEDFPDIRIPKIEKDLTPGTDYGILYFFDNEFILGSNICDFAAVGYTDPSETPSLQYNWFGEKCSARVYEAFVGFDFVKGTPPLDFPS